MINGLFWVGSVLAFIAVLIEIIWNTKSIKIMSIFDLGFAMAFLAIILRCLNA